MDANLLNNGLAGALCMFRCPPFYILILSMVLSACGSPSPTQEEQPFLRVAMRDAPGTLDPRFTRGIYDCAFVQLLYEGLTRQREGGALEPALAESWEISEDACTYTFHLREAHWSDGQPVTARDFFWSWLGSLSPSSPAKHGYQAYCIRNAREVKRGLVSEEELGLSVLDDRTFRVQLSHPNPSFLELVSTTWLMPVPSHCLESPSQALEDRLSIEAPSCGPFSIQELGPGGSVLVANPYYWDAGAVNLKRIELPVVPDANTAVEMLEAGELDYVGLPFGQLTQEAALHLAQLGRVVDLARCSHFITVNSQRAPLTHPKIREALSLAIDRPALAEFVFQRGALPLSGILPKDLALNPDGMFATYDPTRAKALFDQALAELGVSAQELPPLTLIYNQGDCNAQYLQQIQEDWRQVLGVTVNLEVHDFPTVVSRLLVFDLELSRNALFPPTRDPLSFLELFQGNSDMHTFCNWDCPDYSELLEQARRELDPVQRSRLLSEAERLLLSQHSVFPVVCMPAQGAVARDVKMEGLERAGTSYLDLKRVVVRRLKK